MEPRIDPAEEARHMGAMHGLGVHGAAWALAKKVAVSDVDWNQSRLLLVEALVQGGPIPELFPELGELGHIRSIGLNMGCRIMGPGWRWFVRESGISRGDRIDVYTCSRGDGERCLFFFKS